MPSRSSCDASPEPGHVLDYPRTAPHFQPLAHYVDEFGVVAGEPRAAVGHARVRLARRRGVHRIEALEWKRHGVGAVKAEHVVLLWRQVDAYDVEARAEVARRRPSGTAEQVEQARSAHAAPAVSPATAISSSFIRPLNQSSGRHSAQF